MSFLKEIILLNFDLPIFGDKYTNAELRFMNYVDERIGIRLGVGS